MLVELTLFLSWTPVLYKYLSSVLAQRCLTLVFKWKLGYQLSQFGMNIQTNRCRSFEINLESGVFIVESPATPFGPMVGGVVKDSCEAAA